MRNRSLIIAGLCLCLSLCWGCFALPSRGAEPAPATPPQGCCATGVSWQADLDGQRLLLSDLSAAVEAGWYCWLGFYDESGKLLAAGCQQLTAADSAVLTYAAFTPPEHYSLKLFFTDGDFIPQAAAEEWDLDWVAPTCTKKGYLTVSGGVLQQSQICRITPAQGHSYGEWRLLIAAGEVDCGLQEHTCTVCGATDRAALYPTTDFPILRLNGSIEGIDKNTEVSLSAGFDGAGQSFSCPATLKYQGHSSIVYVKKNFTLKFYRDEARTEGLKLSFYDWQPESKYILKANYIDPAKCRNLVCAELWSEICQSRDGTKHIKNLFNYGATDGMATAVYLNDVYLGLFDLTLHKDDDLYDLDKGQDDALMVINHCTGDASLFRAAATFGESDDWELEFCGSEDTLWAQRQLNAFIDFVLTAPDTEFANKKLLKTYVNIDSAIDYLLAIYSLGLTNSAAKNLVLLSYGQDPWICSLYDMENAFGLYIDGSGVYEATYFLPEKTDGVWDSHTGSLLWDRLLQCYESRIRARYSQLRETVLTEEHILDKVNAYSTAIPAAFYQRDMALYPAMPRMVAPAPQQIGNYLAERFALLDALFLDTAVTP